MKGVTLLFVLLGVMLLSACSGTQRAYLQNIELALADNSGVVLTVEDIVKSEVDLIYVSHGDRAQATMGLAFIEGGQYKWLSADNVMFVTQNGRFVKTLGLDFDLLGITELQQDPLTHQSKVSPGAKWQRLIDIGPGRFSLLASTTNLTVAKETLNILEHPFKVTRVEEDVELTEQDKTYALKNIFWYEIDSGMLVKSSQQYSHISDPITMTYISRVARLLPNSEAD